MRRLSVVASCVSAYCFTDRPVTELRLILSDRLPGWRQHEDSSPRGTSAPPVAQTPHEPRKPRKPRPYQGQGHGLRHGGGTRTRSQRTVESDCKRIKVFRSVRPGYRAEGAAKLDHAVAFVAADNIAQDGDRRATELTIRAASLKRRCGIEGERCR